jgi:hypothetical protein
MTSHSRSKKGGFKGTTGSFSRSRKIKKEGSRERSSLQIAIKANPKLWEKIKKQVTEDSKGGPSGKWSARKAMIAVKIYKDQGGTYVGSKNKSNSLKKWADEKWDYVGKEKHSRYLPEKVRSHLSSSGKRSESRKKNTRYGEWVPYGEEVTKLMHKFKIVKRSKSRSR